MVDILEIFESILRNARSIDVAESEFKRLVYEEPEVRAAYRVWCDEEGNTEKHGFVDYCQERFDDEENLWNALTDEDEFN